MRARHATLRYDLDTSTVDATLHASGGAATDARADGPGAHCLQALGGVTTRNGEPPGPLDLFVGATLRLLGGTMVLRSCSLATGVDQNESGFCGALAAMSLADSGSMQLTRQVRGPMENAWVR